MVTGKKSLDEISESIIKPYKKIIDALYKKWGHISITLLQRHLNLAYNEAKVVYESYMKTKEE